MASEVRSGSTFIAESIAYELNKNCGYEFWGLTHEKFSHLSGDSDPAEILSTLSGLYLDKCGFASSKVMCKALSIIHREANKSSEVREAFWGDNTYWIVVRRKDRIKQAISLAVARKSQTYHFYDNPDKAPDRDMTVSDKEISDALQAICLSDVFLETFAQSLPENRSISIFYEDYMKDEVGHLNKIHALCGFEPIEADKYVNLAKLLPTGKQAKQQANVQFRNWFLENYY